MHPSGYTNILIIQKLYLESIKVIHMIRVNETKALGFNYKLLNLLKMTMILHNYIM